jgi:hypothetical protein
MSRLDQALRRCAATSLLLVVIFVWVPLAHAHGNGALTKQYPLGTQTLCCKAGSGQSNSSAAKKKVAAGHPRTPSAVRPTRTDGAVSILLVLVIAVIAFAPVAFILRAGLSSRRGRRTRRDPDPDPDPNPEPDSNMDPTAEPEPSTSEA